MVFNVFLLEKFLLFEEGGGAEWRGREEGTGHRLIAVWRTEEEGVGEGGGDVEEWREGRGRC